MEILNFLKILTAAQIKEIMKENGIWQDGLHNFGYLRTDHVMEIAYFIFSDKNIEGNEVGFYFSKNKIIAKMGRN